jgi:Predicted redox protein, regulator of disulfide bond formation
MSADTTLRITLEQEDDYAFRIRFDDTAIADLMADEPAPLGKGEGPNPTRLLLAAVANCLSASLLFALRKFKNAPGKLVTQRRPSWSATSRAGCAWGTSMPTSGWPKPVPRMPRWNASSRSSRTSAW